MDTPPIVSAQDWEHAREQLLVKEKEVMRAHDALAAMRRRMPWVAVDKRLPVRRAPTAGDEVTCWTCSMGGASRSSTAPSSSRACTAGRTTGARVAR